MKKLIKTKQLAGCEPQIVHSKQKTLFMSSVSNFSHNSLFRLLVDFFNAGTRAAVSSINNFKNHNLFQS